MSGANQDQVALWNEASGRTWVELQSVLDRLLEPFAALLVNEGSPGEGGRVLDIGCGAGATTLAMARRLGPKGRCVGVDISEPLLSAAKAAATAEQISTAAFIQADAQTHAFEPGSFDAVISRFGVMFFDDPEAAFANIRRAVTNAGKLAFVAWRSPAENPFMTTARRAAEPMLPNMPTADPRAPGQFAFADGDRVRQILASSGWSDIEVRPIDIEGVIAENDLLAYATKLGPVGVALREVDEATRAGVSKVVHTAFESYVQNGVARFNMACWLVKAIRVH
ncbi:class I SAM-dependent methyltransferase [Steroidobacter sp. S1-65]|uniref:Class I SAM-dependent methyltransferase n=1 Tax=Steroidobacter gossypii TaxID=2805490 RepID=A0ABS1WYJ7_9GAMM|nr:class I SAM-dependent methyltransferase [Steroidobacter gossypii]MBM0106057.1 class I SAM-dependent methyltransferase [Steroidobacter gossypii]